MGWGSLMPNRRQPVALISAALLGCGVVGFALADYVAAATDPSVFGSTLLVGAVVGASTAAIGLGLLFLVSRAQSHAHHVFCSRHTLASMLISVALGTALLVPTVRRDLFQDLLSTGHIHGATLVDLGLTFAVAACLIGAIAAAVGTIDAIREERSWGVPRGIIHPPSRHLRP